MNKVYMIFSFFILTIIWSIFILVNPEIVFGSKEKFVEFYQPKISISNNKRILSFKHENKEYIVLCSYLSNGVESFCDKGGVVVESVKGKYFTNKFVKNRKTNDLIIMEILYRKNGEFLKFFVPDVKVARWEEALNFINKNLILFLVVSSYLIIFVYFLKIKFSNRN
mgnify:CR=1 FL=1